MLTMFPLKTCRRLLILQMALNGVSNEDGQSNQVDYSILRGYL